VEAIHAASLRNIQLRLLPDTLTFAWYHTPRLFVKANLGKKDLFLSHTSSSEGKNEIRYALLRAFDMQQLTHVSLNLSETLKNRPEYRTVWFVVK
jgi:hypothetical protein